MNNQVYEQYNGKEAQICLHHFSLKFTENQNIKTKLQSTRFVFVAGCPHRARRLGIYLEENLFNGWDKIELQLDKLTHDGSRFDLYQIGPALVGNHGMGSASMSIALHELFLMCKLANVIDKITLIRFGTCGGIGVQPGTLCITTKALDPLFRDYIEIPICGKLVRRPCVVDQKTASILGEVANKLNTFQSDEKIKLMSGGTVSTNDFYEEQGRTNGAICDHSPEDKIQFLMNAHKLGIINFEMEANYLAAMCTKLNVSHGIVCVSLNNRLIDDATWLSHEQIKSFERKLFLLTSSFISHVLENNGDKTYELP